MTTLCLALALTLAAQPALAADCINKNTFLNDLVTTHGLTPNSHPVKVKDHCRREWSDHGSCCSVSEITKYVAWDKERLNVDTEVLNVLIPALKALFKDISPSIAKWASLIPNTPSTTRITQYITNTNEATKDTSANHNKCWITEMSALRSSSLCYTCSGRSNVFFNGNKALVTYASCTRMLDSCSDSIGEIVELILTTEETLKILSTLEENSADSTLKQLNIKKKEGLLKNCLKKIREKDIKNLLDIYHESLPSSQQEKKVASMLCQDFLKLKGKLFVPTITTLIKVILSPLFEISYIKFAVNSFLLEKNTL